MKNKLFWRLFWAFLATLLLTTTILSASMLVMISAERRQSLSDEVQLQARDVAWLLRSWGTVRFKRGEWTLQTTLGWKLAEIQENYDASMWLVSGAGNIAYSLFDDEEIPEDEMMVPEVAEQMHKVLSGEEIVVQGLFDRLGKNIVTIGVPWLDQYENVNGALLLHVSVDELEAPITDIARFAVIAALISLLIGTLLAYWISSRQTRPLKQIEMTVSRFAKGELDARVHIKGDDEMTHLADAFNKMAVDLSNLETSRRNFVASVSHELRSPLTCISGYVEGMMDGTIPAEEHPKYMGVVRSEAARLTKLVNELLDLSRMDSDSFPITMGAFDINELIRVALLKYEHQIEEKHMDVDVIFKQPQEMVWADADRISQVMTNLIDNAVKFTPDGGTLRLSTHSVDQKCYVSVTNTGEPIAQEDLPFLFERFYKADKAHTSGMGTGLGLSIAQHIMEQHGQQISVTSGAAGTTFSFALGKSEPQNTNRGA